MVRRRSARVHYNKIAKTTRLHGENLLMVLYVQWRDATVRRSGKRRGVRSCVIPSHHRTREPRRSRRCTLDVMSDEWTTSTLKEHMQRELELRDVATVQLRECNLEAIRSADRVGEARIAALGARLDHLERTNQQALDRLTRLVYIGLGVVLALEFLIPLLRR